MVQIKFYFSLIIARLMFLFLRITKLSQGTAFIGFIVLKICPEFLKYANKYVTNSKINVTGTNGKTTTSAIIAQVLKHSKKTLLYNSTGANMLTGIVNSMSLQINPFTKKEYSVIECDEGFLKKLYESYEADYLVITNLFEDQLDRYGSIDGTKNLIQRAIDIKENLQLILNADDPFVANITSKSKRSPVFYGVNSITYADSCNITELQKNHEQTCSCGEKLSYSKQFYSKIGHYSCSCGYTRPNPKYNANIVIYKNSCEIEVNNVIYKAPLMGIFNAYNALAAISLLLEIGINPEEIQKAVADYKVFSGRCEYKYLNKHKVLIQLIKNPVGATEVLKTVDLDSNIFIAVNDNAADGRDFSWINNVEFELLKNAKKEIVVSGIRAKEVEERLKKAGCKEIKVISDLAKAVKYLEKTSDGNITMLPNYTVLQQLDKMQSLKK